MRGNIKIILELIAAMISFCKSTAGPSAVTRAQDKLVVFPSQESQRSLQLSLTGALRALFCCYCVYVLLDGALVCIKP